MTQNAMLKDTAERPTLSVLVPTIGRPTLARTLRSLQDLEAADEVIVIGDGEQKEAQSEFHRSALPGIYISVRGPSGDWGHTPRNLVMSRARGDYLLHMDDDDYYLPGAVSIIRAALLKQPGLPHLFRMRLGGGILWQRPTISCGNVSTQMFVHPNLPDTFGTWKPVYGGDADFIRETSSRFPDVIWREDVIAVHER